MPTTKFPDDVQISGALLVQGGIQGQQRDGLNQDDIQVYNLPLVDWSVWDNYQTRLGTPGSDDLGIVAGAFGTGCPYLSTGDVKALGTISRYARTEFTVPAEYAAGETAQLRFAAGMLTTLAATSATLDVEVYINARNTLKTGPDLVVTAAQSMNSLTFAELVFELNAISLEPGIVLDIRVVITTVDAATVTAVIAALARTEIQLDIKG